MDAANMENLSRPIPIVTVILLFVGISVFLIPETIPWLIYDRSAILSGEVWRIFTGHMVHFSGSHLLYDLLVLGITGSIIERRNHLSYGWFCVLSAMCISLTLLVFEPNMHFYGGFSGIAFGGFIYLALDGFRESGPWQQVCLIAFLLGMSKLFLELIGQWPESIIGASGSFVSVPLSHLVGSLIALIFQMRYIKTAYDELIPLVVSPVDAKQHAKSLL
ncbi:MAG: rhombosortase [Nitrospirales bacterium]|nr:rhombosortase [Nitrospirales bacterium]